MNSMRCTSCTSTASAPTASPARRFAKRSFGTSVAWILANRVRRHGQSAARRLGLGTAHLFASRSEAREPVGGGPHAAPAGSTPVPALDMYEHSYHLDYGAVARNTSMPHAVHRLDERVSAPSAAGARAEVLSEGCDAPPGPVWRDLEWLRERVGELPTAFMSHARPPSRSAMPDATRST